MKMFRRNTHTRDGQYKQEEFASDRLSWLQRQIWDTHGHIVHMLSSDKGMSYEELLHAIRADTTNFSYEPADLKDVWVEGEALPTPEAVALSLVRCIEGNFVEVIDEN